jgi:hypothetical protein
VRLHKIHGRKHHRHAGHERTQAYCLINRIKTNRILAYLGMRCDDLIGVCFVFFSQLFGTFCWMILVHYKHEFYFFSYGLRPYALHVLILDDIIYYWNHQLRIEQGT